MLGCVPEPASSSEVLADWWSLSSYSSDFLGHYQIGNTDLLEMRSNYEASEHAISLIIRVIFFALLI